jgi:hypothetical protein
LNLQTVLSAILLFASKSSYSAGKLRVLPENLFFREFFEHAVRCRIFQSNNMQTVHLSAKDASLLDVHQNFDVVFTVDLWFVRTEIIIDTEK